MGTIIELLKKALKKEGVKLKDEEIEKFIEVPPSAEMGDYAFPCFFLSDRLKMEPHEIALILREHIGTPGKEFDDIQTSGPYVNFFIDRKLYAENMVNDILTKKDKFGKSTLGNKTKTMIEFPSPNTNKPLHLGHLRNMSIGESISKILEFNGEKVIKANLYNDRGIHISKSMLAYQLFGKNKSPKQTNKKSDHFVGDFYVMYNEKVKTKKSLEVGAHDMLRKWEEKDRRTRVLWEKMNKWALYGFNQTYRKFGIKFDKEYFESELYRQGKKIIEKGVKKGVLKREKDGAVYINLKKEKLGKKYLLRADGTSLYVTQDVYLAVKKIKDYNLNKSIYIVGDEQDYHFKVLFLILSKLGLDSKFMKHLSYGMVFLPEGRMKSREGTSVDADDIIDKVQKLAMHELKKRGSDLKKEKLEERGLGVAIPAIKYLLLKNDIRRKINFNPNESISFEGDTGPYVLYSYARASSILRKTQELVTKQYNLPELELKEIELIKKLSKFPGIVESAYKNLNPALIANYSHQLAQLFNEFYHACPVIGENPGQKQEMFRVALVGAFKQVQGNALSLLGIKPLEEM